MRASERLLIGALCFAAVDSGYLTWRYFALRLALVTPGSSICSWSNYIDCDRVLLTPQANAFFVPNGLLGFGFYVGCIVWWVAGTRLGSAYRRYIVMALAFWLAVATIVTLRFFWLLVHLPVFCPLCPLNHVATYVALGASLVILRNTKDYEGKIRPALLLALVMSCIVIFVAFQAIWFVADVRGAAVACHTPKQFAGAMMRFPSGYTTVQHVKPCSLVADFDGDGVKDIAVTIRQRATGKNGVAIFNSHTKRWHILGAGTRLGDGGDDFSWMDLWSVYPKTKTVERGVESGAPPALRGDALLVEKSEAASALIYWTGRGYRWYQQGD